MVENTNTWKCFDGMLKVYEHDSATIGGRMSFAIFYPPSVENPPCLWFLAGITCDHLRFTEKASTGLESAAQHGIAMIFPDTSPRGLDIPGFSDQWDFGNAAGFYLDATQDPWATNFKMYSYITEELHVLVGTLGVNSENSSIMGHSMGGLGSLNLGISNPSLYRSISALAPLCNPSTAESAKAAFTRYLGEDQSAWAQYDPMELVKAGKLDGRQVLVHTGADDTFWEKLKMETFQEVCSGKDNVKINIVEGYGHNYYFICTYARQHIEFHASILKSQASEIISIQRGNVKEDVSICVGEDWTDAGKKDPDTERHEAEIYAVMAKLGCNFTDFGAVVSNMRAFLTHSHEDYPVNPDCADEWAVYANYCDQVTVELRTDVGGPTYHPNAAVVDAYLIKVKGKSGDQKCLVYFHGGGGIGGTAEEHNYYCWRMAVDYDATVINVNYRLAPEHKIPCGIDDSYAAVKWVIEKASELGIDSNRIATIGESGGGFMVAGASMRLGEANEADLIKFAAQLIPMVSNAPILTPDSELDEEGLVMKGFTKAMYEALGDYAALEAGNFTDKWMFPMCIDDDLCKKCPPAVIITGEFDDCKTGAFQTAEIYRRNNNLLVFGSQRGSNHGHYFKPNHCRTNAWHKAIAEIMRKYL